MIVWLASYPRSGNTFFRILLNHLYGIKTHSIYDDKFFERSGASTTIGHELLPTSIQELDRSEEVFFVKTHALPSDSKPAVYLVRDGRDSVVSYARYQIEFVQRRTRLERLKDHFFPQDRFYDTLKDTIENERDGRGWGNHVFSWRRDHQGPMVTVRFEDLVSDPAPQVTNALETLELPVPPLEGQPPTFEELHNKWPTFFRKGKTGGWREEMPDDLHELFWEIHGDAMGAMGYTRAG
jgi:hypothetical protein